MRVENAQPTPSVLSKSNIAIFPAMDAALVMVQALGELLKVAMTMSAVLSKLRVPVWETPMAILLTIAAGAWTSSMFAGLMKSYMRMRGRLPSAGVNMFALLKLEVSCA